MEIVSDFHFPPGQLFSQISSVLCHTNKRQFTLDSEDTKLEARNLERPFTKGRIYTFVSDNEKEEK